MTDQCGHWMPRAKERCALIAGHLDHHRSARDVANKAAYEASDRGRMLMAARSARRTESGRHAEAVARYDRRKAEECDNQLLEELTCRG